MGLRLSLPPQTELRSSRQETILKYWGHFQHELLFICWGVMDVALLTPVALSILPWARYWPPGLVLLALLLLMMLSFNLTRLMSVLQLRPSIQQTVTAVSLTLIIILSLRTLLYAPQSLFDMGWLAEFFSYINTSGNILWLRDVVLFGLIILMWARGIQMAGRFFTIDRIGLRLRLGGLMLAPFVIWLGSRTLLWSTIPFILLFFLAGLTAVALTRAEEISRDETGFSASLTPRWLLIILMAGLGVVLAAGLLAILISGESAAGAFGIVESIWLTLKLIGTIVLFTLGYILQLFFSIFVWIFVRFADTFGFIGQGLLFVFVLFAKIISKLFWPEEAVPEDVPLPGDLEFPFRESPDIGFGLGANGQIIVVLMALAIIFTVALLLRYVYRVTAVAVHTTDYAQRNVAEEDEEDGLWQRFRGKLGWRNWRTAVSIRRIYKKMMQAAAENGYPKLESETPYEYLASLDKAWPQNPQDIRIITEAYVKIRYGELPETAAELDQIRAAWQHLQQIRPSKTPL